MGLIRPCFLLRRCDIYRLRPVNISQSKRLSTSSPKRNEEVEYNGRPEFDDFNPTPQDLVKPFIFTIGFSSASIALAKLWEKTGKAHDRKTIVSEEDLKSKKLNVGIGQNMVAGSVDVFFPICFLNFLVFAAWRFRGLQPTMVRYFLANPATPKNCWPMLFSAFSHISPFHLFANMYVLNSFAPVASLHLGPEQFFGFYFSAAVISSFASYAARVVLQRPGFSLGASGAVMAVLACTTVLDPDMGVTIFPFAMVNLKASHVLLGLMTADIVGLFSSTSTFDHGAHLGGSLFGIFWALVGSRLFWEKKNIYDVRSKRKK